VHRRLTIVESSPKDDGNLNKSLMTAVDRAGSEAKRSMKAAGKKVIARSSGVGAYVPFDGLRREVDRLFE
jgi:hypothetical protein